MATVADLVRARAGDHRPGLVFEDRSWSWAEWVQECERWGSLLQVERRPGPFHVGVLLQNVPEYTFILGGAALTGAVVVGLNPTHRGAELERDIRHTDCQLVLTDQSGMALLDGLDHGLEADRVLDASSASLALPAGGLQPVDVAEPDLYLLLFTSGTSGAPKACLCSQGRLARVGQIVTQLFSLGPDDVCYQAMPLFHSNALMAGWAPCLAAGATAALRRKFSASGFLPDVRRFGVTYFNYVGKPLAYILATPEQPDDADTPLTRVFGNEASEADMARFRDRFGCSVTDGYGSTEGGATVSRTPDTPAGSLGPAAEGTVVLDPETGLECPVAEFSPAGELLNADAAIGELANRLGASSFEGYYKNDAAMSARVRDGIYWTGDLAYRDAAGFIYFAGRDYDWLRVDGENFAAAPVERILGRHPDVVLAAVYAVPDEDTGVGDQVMAALQLRPEASFDPEAFAAFLAQQPDLGTKWAPRYVRLCDALPVTETSKVLKRVLRSEGWRASDPVWVRGGSSYRLLTAPTR